jgi:hypothetical protein
MYLHFWGCSGIIRVGAASHERHMTGTHIGIIAYKELRLLVLSNSLKVSKQKEVHFMRLSWERA